MPVINASAGLGDSIAKGVAQGTENFVGQARQNVAQDQDQQRLDQLERSVKVREAEFEIRKAERQRILGERQAAIEVESKRLRRKAATNVGAAAITGAMGSGVDPMNPLFWGYAGQQIARETERMATEVMEFEALMTKLPDAARRELGEETMARMQVSMLSKQDKLRRYGVTSQINEWLAQNSEDTDAFAPIIDGVRQGQITPESALKQLMTRQAEVQTRQVAQVNAQNVEALGQALIQTLGALGNGTSTVAQSAVAGARMRVAMGGPVDDAIAAMMTDMLSPQVQRAMVDNYDRGQAANLRSKASKAARDRLADDESTPPPGYPIEKWVEMTGPEKIDVWTMYEMGQDWTEAEAQPEEGPKGPPPDPSVEAPFTGGQMWSREPLNTRGGRQNLKTGMTETGDEERDRKALQLIQKGATDEEIKAVLRGE